jgi:hypothetical protein
MVNGTKASNMAMGSGVASLVTLTLASGVTLRLKVSESILGKTEIVMRVSGGSASSMVKGLIFSRTEIPTQVSIKRVNLMAKVSTPGRTAHFMWESLSRVSNTEKAGGRVRRALNQAINTREITLTTRNKDTACSHGPAETHTKVNTKKTSVTAMVR